MTAANVPLILVHSKTTDATISSNLGLSEYSYYFVLRAFRPMLERIGTVVEVRELETQVDAIYHDCVAHGIPCVFLNFAPPNHVPLALECPTVPVFAWEFSTLPSEPFNGKPRNDWVGVLKRLGAAITHSSYTANTVRHDVGVDFPVVSVPAPLWNRYAAQRTRVQLGKRRLRMQGALVDSRETDLSPYTKRAVHDPDCMPPLPSSRRVGDIEITLEGVVYTSIMNPGDGRKNWMDMIQAFCHAFRDVPDATLVLKLTHHDHAERVPLLLNAMYHNNPFACRLLLLHGYLDDEAYAQLLDVSTYTVNTSFGEGQCLPLMEYMSAGVPAVTPRHTAMLDYVNSENAFVVNSWPSPGTWPHDPRQAIRTLRQMIDFGSLVEAYRKSHRVAREDPGRYAMMSAAATRALSDYCAIEPNTEKLREFLRGVLTDD